MPNSIWAQGQPAANPWEVEEFPPKREFRAVWIASVFNTDYPRKPSPMRVAIKEQYKNLIRELRDLGFNAVVVQIRPAADALYPSKFAPWSQFLTGKQGQAPVPTDFDPLAFLIEETHRQGMEFHAWMNPYRATVNLDTAGLAANHIFNIHRDWLITYGNKMYLNPGIPEVRTYLVDVVGEVIDNYEVDGIHFDDYFYPYKIKDLAIPDSTTHQLYGQGFNNIDDWRRTNTDALIIGVSHRIKVTKPHVKFGISPFGVWSNRDQNTMGSDTWAGVTSYYDLYADVLKWVKRGWIDYIAPQLYWNIGFPPADYATLVDWWSSQVSDQQLYIGQAAYKVGDNPEPGWQDSREIPRQISLNRQNLKVSGSIFYNASSIRRNRLGLKDSLKLAYRDPALIPLVVGQEGRTPGEPRFKKVGASGGEVRLKWKPNKNDTYIKPAYYIIYRFDGPRIGNYDDPRNILNTTPFLTDEKKMIYFDLTAERDKIYTYAISAVNRLHQEGRASFQRPVQKLGSRVKRINARQMSTIRQNQPVDNRPQEAEGAGFRF